MNEKEFLLGFNIGFPEIEAKIGTNLCNLEIKV
jgi:hypothetical protein